MSSYLICFIIVAMERINLWSLLFAWCIVMRSSTQCLSRYITEPIDRFSCQSPIYKNISDVHFHQCSHACIGNNACWSLSYNQPDRKCLLAEVPCVTADVMDGFSIMILRTKESQHCVEWIPFNRTYGKQYGFPERAVQVALLGVEHLLLLERLKPTLRWQEG